LLFISKSSNVHELAELLNKEVLKDSSASNNHDKYPVSLNIVEHIELFGTNHSAIDFIEKCHEDESVEKNSIVNCLVRGHISFEEWSCFSILNIPH